jgi:putative transposase
MNDWGQQSCRAQQATTLPVHTVWAYEESNGELGKILASTISDELTDDHARSLHHHGSTSKLIRHYRKLRGAPPPGRSGVVRGRDGGLRSRISPRKVDDLVKALGADTGISKSEVSRICAGLDAEVAQFRDRTLASQDFPYVFLDATYCKARVGHRIVSQAVVVAVGVAADGRREVLGFDVGDSENEDFWTAFLRSLKTRGLGGVKLVMSDAHAGLKKAIGTVFQGASWQRCRVHFMRNVLAVVPKGRQEMVASIIRTIFAQRDAKHIRKQFAEVTTMLARSHPKVVGMLTDAESDLLAFAGFPQRHWRQVWSTNPLERVNKEIKRRTDVVGVFPNTAALLRLTGSVLIEQHDEWKPANAATSPKHQCSS